MAEKQTQLTSAFLHFAALVFNSITKTGKTSINCLWVTTVTLSIRQTTITCHRAMWPTAPWCPIPVNYIKTNNINVSLWRINVKIKKKCEVCKKMFIKPKRKEIEKRRYAKLWGRWTFALDLIWSIINHNVLRQFRTIL